MRSKAQIIKWILVAIVVIIILQITIFSRNAGQEHIFKPLFWELKNGMWKDIWMNVLLFVPLGSIVGGRKGIITGLLLSCCIEITQYVFCLGYCEMDDVLNNTLGASLGVGIRSLLGVGSVALRRWEELPEFMRTPEVRPYWEKLNKKRFQLGLKRAFDLCAGSMVLLVTAIPMGVIAVAIKLDSKGPVFYRQERVTTYGKKFKIHKFRTMVSNADNIGTALL